MRWRNATLHDMSLTISSHVFTYTSTYCTQMTLHTCVYQDCSLMQHGVLWNPPNHFKLNRGQAQPCSIMGVRGSACKQHGDVAQMVERMLSMHEAQGSIPCFSTFALWPRGGIDAYISQGPERLPLRQAHDSVLSQALIRHRHSKSTVAMAELDRHMEQAALDFDATSSSDQDCSQCTSLSEIEIV